MHIENPIFQYFPNTSTLHHVLVYALPSYNIRSRLSIIEILPSFGLKIMILILADWLYISETRV